MFLSKFSLDVAGTGIEPISSAYETDILTVKITCYTHLMSLLIFNFFYGLQYVIISIFFINKTNSNKYFYKQVSLIQLILYKLVKFTHSFYFLFIAILTRF